MRKLLLIFFVLLFPTILPYPTHAQTKTKEIKCSLTPNFFSANYTLISFSIQSDGLVEGKSYYVQVGDKNISKDPGTNINIPGSAYVYQYFGGQIDIQNLGISVDSLAGSGRIYESNKAFSTIKFPEGAYPVKITEPVSNGAQLCITSFEVKPTPQNLCTIDFNNTLSADKELKLIVKNIPDFTKERRIIMRYGGRQGSSVAIKNKNPNCLLGGPQCADPCFSEKDLLAGKDLGKFEAGNYYLEVRDSCNQLGFREDAACFATFNIAPQGKNGRIISQGDLSPTPKQPPCAPGAFSSANGPEGGCKKIRTAIGDIDTKPAALIRSLFVFVLGISGGIAALIIMFSGYRMVVSRGDPEKIQGARESITAAIVGLVFTIFSLIILQFIGVDILKIPGLN